MLSCLLYVSLLIPCRAYTQMRASSASFTARGDFYVVFHVCGAREKTIFLLLTRQPLKDEGKSSL